jgi:hypothetical protein
VRQLVEDVQRLTKQSADQEAKQAVRVASLEARLATAAAQAASLEERLARQKDYDTVKKDLAILRTLEFSSSQQEEEDSSRPLEVLILERSKVKPLEVLVLERFKLRPLEVLIVERSKVRQGRRSSSQREVQGKTSLDPHFRKVQG